MIFKEVKGHGYGKLDHLPNFSAANRLPDNKINAIVWQLCLRK